MLKFNLKLTSSALALIALLPIPSGMAQDSRWFRVEILVFANEFATPPAGAATAEQWDATPNLAYPTATRFLLDPARVAVNETEYAGDSGRESLLDVYGRQMITLLAEPESMGGPEAMPAQAEPDSAAPPSTALEVTPLPAPMRPVYSEPVSEVAPPSLPRPFVLLPESYQEFRANAAAMARSGRYSVLFHETWVQPVAAEEDSLPIVLDHSGDDQQWPRLQGTITLSLSRYLHVATNLWLNTAGDYLPGNWHMPPPPFGPPSLIVEEEQVIDLAATIGDLPEEAFPVADPALASSPAELAKGGAITSTDALSPVMPAVEDIVEIVDETALMEPAAPVYPYRHAVLLEQKRRMRSTEVMYIDHPLLGVVIKFSAVSAEQLGAIAIAQENTAVAAQIP